MRSGSIILIVLAIASFIVPINVSAADVLETKYATVLDFDKVHQALDYVTGSMVPSGGDFWIADRTPNALAHNWEGGGNTEGIIDMGLKKFDEVTEAPAAGYQTDTVAMEGHTYVTSSPGKGRYGKFYIDDVVRAGDRPSLTVTEFSIRYTYQPNGSRNLVTAVSQTQVTQPPVVTQPPTVTQPTSTGSGTSGGTTSAGGGPYENYKGSPDGGGDVRMNYWHAQTFTALANHQVNSVKLLAYRIGTPSTLIVSLRVINSSGHPSGSDLASGSTSGDTLPLSQPGEWREITFYQPVNLVAGTKYAIVARAPGGGGGNAVKWMTDSTAPDYTSGNRESSGDSGASWQSDFNSDYLFEIWDTSSDSGTSSGTGTGTDTDTGTGTSVVTGLGIRLVAESRTASPNSTIQVPILLNNASNIGSMNFVVTYNPQVLRVNKVDSGSLLSGALFTPNYQSPPEVRCGVATSGGVSGSGTMAYIEFQVIGTAGSSSPLTFSELSASTTSGQSIIVSVQNGTVTVASDKLKGDYNGDGKVTEVDALAALKMSVKLLTQDLTLDMNGDGKVTAEDARLILKKALGK